MKRSPIIEYLAGVGFLGTTFVEELALRFKFEDFAKCDLGAFDFAGKDSFPRSEWRQQDIRVGNASKDAFVASNCRIGRPHQREQCGQIKGLRREAAFVVQYGHG
jgi:hypothetical protein